MRSIVRTSLAAAALALSAPSLAQEVGDQAPQKQSAQELDKVAGLMAGLFQTDPLTPAQETRLPAARAVVGAMMPEGFYGTMMADMMDSMMRPMMSMFAAPEFVLASRLELEQETIDSLGEAEQAELLALLDPAHERRVDAMIEALTGGMGGMFAAMEGPMRDGLSKAYAVRFDSAQLADIAAFFATPTGSVYATQSMALFADPQVMQASMQALPAVMGGMGDMETAMAQAMASLPPERDYADLSAAERTRMAQLLGVEPAALASMIKPPKDGSEADDEAGGQ